MVRWILPIPLILCTLKVKVSKRKVKNCQQASLTMICWTTPLLILANTLRLRSKTEKVILLQDNWHKVYCFEIFHITVFGFWESHQDYRWTFNKKLLKKRKIWVSKEHSYVPYIILKQVLVTMSSVSTMLRTFILRLMYIHFASS